MTSGLLIHGMFFQQPEGELQNTVVLLFTSPAVEHSFCIALLASAASMGEEARREGCEGTYHILPSSEGLLIPAYELEEKQSFIFALFSCLQIKVKAPVLQSAPREL